MTTIISMWTLDDLRPQDAVQMADDALEAGRAGHRSAVVDMGGYSMYVIFDGREPTAQDVHDELERGAK